MFLIGQMTDHPADTVHGIETLARIFVIQSFQAALQLAARKS
jgi:hypothetical protein